MDKKELDSFIDIPTLEGELEWIIKVIDSTKEPIATVLGQSSLKDDST